MMTVVATSVEYQADNRSEHPAAFLLANISATLLALPLRSLCCVVVLLCCCVFAMILVFCCFKSFRQCKFSPPYSWKTLVEYIYSTNEILSCRLFSFSITAFHSVCISTLIFCCYNLTFQKLPNKLSLSSCHIHHRIHNYTRVSITGLGALPPLEGKG